MQIKINDHIKVEPNNQCNLTIDSQDGKELVKLHFNSHRNGTNENAVLDFKSLIDAWTFVKGLTKTLDEMDKAYTAAITGKTE